MDRAEANVIYRRHLGKLHRISSVEEPQYLPSCTEPYTLTHHNVDADHLFKARRHGIKASGVADVRRRYDRIVASLPELPAFYSLPFAALLGCAALWPAEMEHWKALMSEEIVLHAETVGLDGMAILRITVTCFEELQA